MNTPVLRLSTLAVAAAVILAGGGVATAVPADRPAPEGRAALREFRTAGDAGWFYTQNPVEAANAVGKHRFTPTAEVGQLATTPGPDRAPVRRLRLRSGGPSYMLSASPSEFRDVQRFEDENVLGYVYTSPGPGRKLLLRFSNNGKWRVLIDTAANVAEMTAAGYQRDGPLGWVT